MSNRFAPSRAGAPSGDGDSTDRHQDQGASGDDDNESLGGHPAIILLE
jgi:hypothetical protein